MRALDKNEWMRLDRGDVSGYVNIATLPKMARLPVSPINTKLHGNSQPELPCGSHDLYSLPNTMTISRE